MWGTGNYFAVNASYSHSYRHTVEGTTTTFQMFLAEVLTGDHYDYGSVSNNALRLPPVKTVSNLDIQNPRFDSVKAFTGNSEIYIVYKNAQAYPKYLITYSIQ